MTVNILGKISPREFLDQYWQKKPVLISQALPGFQSPVSANELAGLSLEADVESRIILEHDTSWELIQGPFSEENYTKLPENHWTLLVQAVNHWIPEIHDLLRYFNFIPDWRLDDIMISYATDGGNVGPHFDQYDVFLLQAAGKRHWQVGPIYDETSPTVAGTPLHILEAFQAEQDFILEPGDMLYLPPGVGHHGVAQGECITISIGFRAPSHSEILMHFTDFIADQLPASLRYEDRDLSPPEHPSDIDEATLDRLQNIISLYGKDREQLAQWFGQYMTQPKYEYEYEAYEEEYDALDMSWHEMQTSFNKMTLEVSMNARVASHVRSNHLLFFANGKHYKINGTEEKQLIQQLCSIKYLTFNQWSTVNNSHCQTLIQRLLSEQVLTPALHLSPDIS